MHIWDKKWSGGHRLGGGSAAEALPGRGFWAAGMALSGYAMQAGFAVLAGFVMLAGCASPGPPLPPTLNLPAIVSGTGLTAVRVGGEVRLNWTTPAETTDKLAIKGPVTAVVCRDAVAANAARTPAKPPCAAVARVRVSPGASEAADTLPAELTAGPARLLTYRVELLNAAGRTAGASAAVFASAGPAPAAVDGFAGNVTKAGVVLRWKREEQGTGNRRQGTGSAAGADWVELVRTTLNAPNPAAAERQTGLPGAAKQVRVTRFRAGGPSPATDATGLGDPGGAIDRTAEIGSEYSYTAQQVHAETIGGHELQSRGVVSAAISFAVRDVFPPEIPRGLVAVPAFAGAEQRPAIDLSWEPDVEPRVAGYRVYRREALAESPDRWKPIAPELVAGPAYRDATVLAGHRYAYQVTAVSTTGNESGPSGVAVETAPE